MTESRLFKDPSDGLKALHDGYERWTGLAASRSVEMSFGVLAANWAVYKSTEAIFKNWFAVGSVTVVIIFLAVNLLQTSLMAYAFARRHEYAEADRGRWKQEFEQAELRYSRW